MCRKLSYGINHGGAVVTCTHKLSYGAINGGTVVKSSHPVRHLRRKSYPVHRPTYQRRHRKEEREHREYRLHPLSTRTKTRGDFHGRGFAFFVAGPGLQLMGAGELRSGGSKYPYSSSYSFWESIVLNLTRAVFIAGPLL